MAQHRPTGSGNNTILRSPKQQIWLRTALCGGWCQRMALCNRELHARNDDDDLMSTGAIANGTVYREYGAVYKCPTELHCTDKNSHRLTFQCMKSMPHHTAVHLHGKACTNVIAWQVSTTVLLTAGHQQDLNKGDIKQKKIKQHFHENVHLLKMDSYRFSTIYKTLHIKCDQMEKSPLFLDYILTTAKNEITTEAHQGRVQDAHF